MRIGSHAVIIGAGMAGLLAARALSDAYDEVTIIERDALPDADEPRRAVPQARHVHALLPRGQQCLEHLLPGISAELVADGALEYRALEQMRFAVHGHLLARASTGNGSIVASRAFIEGHVRRRVAALANVAIVDECDALGLVAADGGTRITAVRLLRRAAGSAAQELAADLVVAAPGRGGRLGAWLEELGFERPAEDRIGLDLRYASRRLRIPPGALGDDKLILFGARPDLPRSMALFAQEHDEWLLTLGGYGAHQPPADEPGFDAFAATVAPPDVAAVLARAEPLSDIVRFRFPASVRHRWERLDRLPQNLVPMGDAICAFNPVYGQGMTVAALEAVALQERLAAGPPVARELVRAFMPAVDHAWKLASGADLSQPFVDAPRPLGVRVLGRYMGRVQAAAEYDHDVAAAFIRVVAMTDPPESLLRPAIARRVLRPRRAATPARAIAPRPFPTPVSRE